MQSAEELAQRVVKRFARFTAGALQDAQLDDAGRSLREWEQVRGRYPVIETRFGGPDGLLLYGDRQAELSALARELSDCTERAISAEALEKDLRGVVWSAVEQGTCDVESLQAELKTEFAQRLAEISDTSVVIPVEGLWLGPWNKEKGAAVGPDLCIGEVTFKAGGFKELQLSSDRLFGEEDEFSRVSALAHTDIRVSDPGAAWEQGEFRVRLALDILRTALYRYKGAWGGALGLMSHSTVVYRHILQRAVGTDEPLRDFSSGHRELPLRVEAGHRKVLEQSGLADLPEMFSFASNEVMERLRRSMTWFSDATLEEDMPQSFLKQAVALEILLQGTEGAPIAESLAERVAFLLEQDTAGRIAFRDRVKKLYRYRNMIAHGSAARPALKDFRDFEDVVANSISRYAKRFRHLDRWRDVVADFDQRKFS